jgi:RNA-directed DNA polymerase
MVWPVSLCSRQDFTCSFIFLMASFNPVIRGWMQYYGKFYKSELYPLLYRINDYLVR